MYFELLHCYTLEHSKACVLCSIHCYDCIHLDEQMGDNNSSKSAKHSAINPRNIVVLTSKPYSYITSHKTFTTDVALDTSSPSVAQGIIITTFFL